MNVKLEKVIPRTFIKKINKLAFFSQRCSFHSDLSRGQEYRVKIRPELTKDSRVIMPISMARYDGNPGQMAQYDKEIDILLKYTAESIAAGNMRSVEIISAAGLQKINWGDEKSKSIEEHFFKTHAKLLGRQTKVYTWESLIETLGKDVFNRYYQDIVKRSSPGTEWYKLMLKPLRNSKLNLDKDSSLEYQRLEYAAMRSMQKKYTNILYMGNISLAWAYLYKVYEEENLPIFTRAVVEKVQPKVNISHAEAVNLVRSITLSVEEVILNERFPLKQKMKLVDDLMGLIYAHSPQFKREASENENGNSQESGISLTK